MSIPFFDFTGLFDQSWFLFLLVTLFTTTFGKNIVFQKLQIPVITGYMFLGFLCGPYALKLMSVKQVSELGYVNSAALSFIAFSAGAEIYLPEILPLMKPILWVSFFMILFTMIFGTLFSYGMIGTPILSWLDHSGNEACNFGVAMLIATILSARSPTSVLAVVRELQASGPITHIMIGITVAGDVFVLTIFAIVMAMTIGVCSGAPFSAADFFVNITMIPAAAVWGYGMGKVLVVLLQFKKLKHLILPIGFFIVLLCHFILVVTEETSRFTLDIDSLLVCITAGYVAGNSPVREKLVHYFKELSMYIFIPFFTQVGLQLNMPVLIASIGFAILASIVRAFCMFLGTWAGGTKVGLEKDKALRLWMGMMPQAGVSLGLAGIVGTSFPYTFGSEFQSTMVGVILVNQIVGPIGAKFLIKYCGEDGKADEHNDALKHTAMAMHDGHIEDHGPPVEAETQTDVEPFESSTPTEVGAEEGAAPDSARRTRVTKGGVEIVDMRSRTKATASPMGPRDEKELMKEVLMDGFRSLQEGTKSLGRELLGLSSGAGAYQPVNTTDAPAAMPSSPTSNPMMLMFNVITEKDEDVRV